MKALICDICGGKLVIQKGGIAKCQNCGLEYAPERLQEMMGAVHVDSSHLNDNYYALAEDSFDTGNYALAEEYCNKIIESDTSYTKAYLLKGKAVGWQTTLASVRFKEAAICFANALNNSDDDSEDMLNEISNQFKDMATSLCNLRTEQFSRWTDLEETDGFCADIREIKSAMDYFTSNTEVKLDNNYIFSEFSFLVYSTIGIDVSNRILLEYYSDPSRIGYNNYVEKTKYCVRILKETIILCDDDDSSDARLFDLIVTMLQRVLDNNKTDYIGDRWGAYTEQPRMSISEQSEIESIINKCKNNKL